VHCNDASRPNLVQAHAACTLLWLPVPPATRLSTRRGREQAEKIRPQEGGVRKKKYGDVAWRRVNGRPLAAVQDSSAATRLLLSRDSSKFSASSTCCRCCSMSSLACSALPERAAMMKAWCSSDEQAASRCD